MENILEIRGLEKKFPDSTFSIHDINLSLPKGAIMGLIGENGAGKTTLIRLILNIYGRSGGKITAFDGLDNVKDEAAFKEAIGSRIEKTCAELGVEIAYAFQEKDAIPAGYEVPAERSKPWGTGQAVLACKNVIKEPFAVINADDYYGKEAFVQIHNFLQGYTPDKPNALSMAGFVLKNTLSDNGAVTRGVCQMNAEGYLTDVVETSGIEKTADGAAVEGKAIDPESLVSMNFWGLTPEFVKVLEDGFVEFFEKSVPANPLKAEYLLPIYIGELLEKNAVTVQVLPTHDKWFGVTYKEDKQTVIDSFAKLVADGVYQKNLFSDLKH